MEDSIYSLRHRDILALCVLGLLCVGVVMVQSASMQVTNSVHWQWTAKATKHVLFAACGLAGFFVVGNFRYFDLARRAKVMLIHPVAIAFAVACVACGLVLIPGVGVSVNGARRWIPLGPMQVQASELGKWGTVLFLAWWLSARPVNMDRFRNFFLTLIPVGFICLLIVIEDFGTAALIGICSFAMLLVGRVKLWHLLVVLPPALLAAFVFVHHEPYRWRRMTAFLDPWATSQKEGYHMIQSLLSFSTGGITGRGIGNGIQKLGYLPEDTTDFIFAVICEELGLFGALLTAAFYLGIVFVAWQVVRKDRDDFGRLLAFGVATMIGLQAAINMAVATVSVPTKGMSLPLISAGGSGLIITCAALGLLYSVMKHDPAHQPAPTVEEEPDLLFVDPPAPTVEPDLE
ncbi:MAG TPA: putative peptidoglycan glycosyltransferase FtsW [Tepidisphaeraceae bacterium]|jgi:cell division protein FtsW